MTKWKTLTVAQTIYILVTAIWPLLDIESFMAVTGPKEDIWLVKTVSALLIPVGITLLVLRSRNEFLGAFVLGSTTAIAFVAIDFYYGISDIIADVYVADGVVQVLIVVSWVLIFLTRRSVSESK